MQYNFEVRTSLSEDELQQVLSQTADGLEGASQIVMRASVRVNTELPEDKVEALRQAVDGFITEKLGAETSVELISQEY